MISLILRAGSPCHMSANIYRFGPFALHSAQRRLTAGGNEIVLQARAFDVLHALVAHRGALVPKRELLDTVWPGAVVEENNLQVHISQLRKALGHATIKTVAGRGYQLALPCASEAADVPAAPPPSPSLLYGRDDDLEECLDLLRHARLVSILGATGVGKTSLARHVAARLHAAFDGRVTWVDLAHATTAADVEAAIARVERPGPRLLVLDNADQVSGATAQMAERLLAQAPEMRLLVTTQVRLNLREESVYRLASLAVPTGGNPAAEALKYGAVALLQARIAARDRHFMLDDGNVGTTIRLCRRLDGLPLALELAAARVPAFGLDGVLRSLDDGLFLLSGGTHAAPPRHRALHSALDWSYGLLRPGEQALYCAMARLPGWFSLDQLDKSPAGRTSLFDAVDTLVDRAFVIFDGARPRPYTLTETGRAFALARRRNGAASLQAS
jgi:predicted ATPase/DNA-binding winged helix-turn-helix (wHTH) protein